MPIHTITKKQILKEEMSMGISGIEAQTYIAETVQVHSPEVKKTTSTEKKGTTKGETVSLKKDDSYEKSTQQKQDSSKQIYTKNSAVIDRLKQDAYERKQQLISLVEKTIGKQGKSYNTLCELFTDIKNGKVSVDPAYIEQAKKDVAEDGYWGVNQTSDRFVEFAKALTGGDSSKADDMIAAIEKGFEQAKKAWGGKLPDICQKTIDATKEKMNQWKNATQE